MGMTFCVGDTHGCLDRLEDLMAELWQAGMNLEKDTIVFLGDYIDRGPDSKGVVDYLIHLHKLYGNDRVICLKGNHEDMCLHNYRHYGEWSNRELGMAWHYNGGHQALASYSPNKDVSQEHLDWMLSLPTMYENEIGYFVHAGFVPWLDDADDSDDYNRMWIRQDFILNPKDFGKMVYFGHTALKGEVLFKPEKTGLDTACVYGYKLSAICCDTGKVFQVPGWVKPVKITEE